MMAMEASTKSARDMLRLLGIEYNRARQAAITQEITEVIAGAGKQKAKKEVISNEKRKNRTGHGTCCRRRI